MPYVCGLNLSVTIFSRDTTDHRRTSDSKYYLLTGQRPKSTESYFKCILYLATALKVTVHILLEKEDCDYTLGLSSEPETATSKNLQKAHSEVCSKVP